MYIKIDQPNAESERQILKLVRGEFNRTLSEQDKVTLSIEDILAARKEVQVVHMSEGVEEYLIQLVVATRRPDKYSKTLAGQVLYGASPRATIALDRAAKINAWIEGRDYVTPEDIHAVVYDILRHRIILSFEAQAEGITTDSVIEELLKTVPLP